MPSPKTPIRLRGDDAALVDWGLRSSFLLTVAGLDFEGCLLFMNFPDLATAQSTHKHGLHCWSIDKKPR